MASVFVTGATGVIGRAAIPHLLAKGYRVRALSRSADNDRAIRELGAEPVRGDLFNTASLAAAMRGAEAVMHLATRIPSSAQMRRRDLWAENDRIRAEGARRLVDAALAGDVRTFVYPSFGFVYPDSGSAWIEAGATPVAPTANLHSTLAAEAEVQRFAGSRMEDGTARRGISLRFGGLYGENVSSAVEQLRFARFGISFFGGRKDAFIPMLWIDDAASALLAALDRAPSGVYDVVDDQPLRQGELAAALAEAAGKRRLVSPPSWAVRLVAGPAGEAMMRSLRISNRRFREATGWAPAMPSAREGLARIAQSTRRPPGIPLSVRAGLAAMATISLVAGAWQQVFPRSFYDDFPGLGRQWVAIDGPYNEHLMRDLGGAGLALGLITAYALFRPTAGLVRAVALAFLVAQVPHFAYHTVHIGLLASPLDRALQTASLLTMLLIPLMVFIGSSGIGMPSGSDRHASSSAKGDALELKRGPLVLPGQTASTAR